MRRPLQRRATRHRGAAGRGGRVGPTCRARRGCHRRAVAVGRGGGGWREAAPAMHPHPWGARRLWRRQRWRLCHAGGGDARGGASARPSRAHAPAPALVPSAGAGACCGSAARRQRRGAGRRVGGRPCVPRSTWWPPSRICSTSPAEMAISAGLVGQMPHGGGHGALHPPPSMGSPAPSLELPLWRRLPRMGDRREGEQRLGGGGGSGSTHGFGRFSQRDTEQRVRLAGGPRPHAPGWCQAPFVLLVCAAAMAVVQTDVRRAWKSSPRCSPVRVRQIRGRAGGGMTRTVRWAGDGRDAWGGGRARIGKDGAEHLGRRAPQVESHLERGGGGSRRRRASGSLGLRSTG